MWFFLIKYIYDWIRTEKKSLTRSFTAHKLKDVVSLTDKDLEAHVITFLFAVNEKLCDKKSFWEFIFLSIYCFFYWYNTILDFKL